MTFMPLKAEVADFRFVLLWACFSQSVGKIADNF
jgi:hypothetical protein